MQYRKLGTSDLEVSEIALGSWLTFGAGVNPETAKACVTTAFDSGINFFEAAGARGRGAAETLLGGILRDLDRPRESYVLATKLFFPTDGDGPLSGDFVRQQVDASLQRLGTDYVDLYQCQPYGDDMPVGEIMQALTRVVESGKVRYIGFSGWRPDQIRTAMETGGVVRFVSSQLEYSLLCRDIETEVLRLCDGYGISQIAWSPLAQGVLTGKYRPGDEPPPDSRAASTAMNGHMADYMRPEVLASIERLKGIARHEDVPLPVLSLAWVLRSPAVASAIIGASKPEQVQQDASASGVALSHRTLEMIEAALAGYDPY